MCGVTDKLSNKLLILLQADLLKTPLRVVRSTTSSSGGSSILHASYRMARLLLGVAAALLVAAAHGQQVTLRGGVFKGATLEAGGGRRVFSFRGIPYAKPPVGPLRFKDPEPLGPWEGIKESFEPPQCPQIHRYALFGGEVKVTGDEDCLYLNVYTPQLCGAELLPVMVYIHGGGFCIGNPDEDGGSPLPLLTRDVVLVTPQYRLGKLGFLSTGDGVIPGNMGLKDQTLALRWVQDNIRSFSGDPERVTIFGISAGAASVHFQMMTPKAQGLFHRAIMQSGSAISPWTMRTDDPSPVAASVARQVECTAVEDGKVDSEALLTCLQGVPAEALVLTLVEGERWNDFPFYTTPRVDGDYLPAHPAQLLREGRYSKVDVISGVCPHDGAYFALKALLSQAGKELLDTVGTIQHEAPLDLVQRIFTHYLGGNVTLTESNVDQMVEMLSDIYFAMPQDLAAQFHARDAAYGRGVYTYQLDHRGQQSFVKAMLPPSTIEMKYVAHADDLQYLFNDAFGFKPLERRDDLFLRELMLDLWTTFAATGNPTPDLSLGFRWAPVTPSNFHYLSLTPAATMRPYPRSQSRAFLTDLPTRVNKMLFPEKFAAAGVAREAAKGTCHA